MQGLFLHPGTSPHEQALQEGLKRGVGTSRGYCSILGTGKPIPAWKGKEASRGGLEHLWVLLTWFPPVWHVGVCLSARVGVGSLLCMFCGAGSWLFSNSFPPPSPCLSLPLTFQLSGRVPPRSGDQRRVLRVTAEFTAGGLGSSASVLPGEGIAQPGEDGRDEKNGRKVHP